MAPRQGSDHRLELVLDQQQAGRAVLHQHRDLGRREPPVQGSEDRSDPDAGEVDGHEVEAVAGQHRHPLADRRAQRLLQQGGAAVNAAVELQVSDRKPGGEVADRQLAGLDLGPIGDGVDHPEGIVGGHGLSRRHHL